MRVELVGWRVDQGIDVGKNAGIWVNWGGGEWN